MRCPFDVSQVACLSGGSDGGSGENEYNPNDPNNELGDVIAIKIIMIGESSGYVDIRYGGGSIAVDCGNGDISFGSSDSGVVNCWFLTKGIYIVKLSGDFTYYGGVSGSNFSESSSCSNCIYTELLKLDKTGITKMSEICNDYTLGSVPPLPSTLKDTTYMFYYCRNLSGKIADFSEFPNLTSYTDMFANSGISQGSNPSWPAEAW